MNKSYSLKLADDIITLTFPDWASQANGSCLAKIGETTVLATAVMTQQGQEQDFFPLTVEYQERYYAAGKILGSRFLKREARPTDEAILNARLIDRIIRPLFPEALKQEVQVIATVLSWDSQHDPDIVAILAASMALAVSNIPWQGPVAALQIGLTNDQFTVNTHYADRESAQLDAVFAGVLDDKAQPLLNMIEASANEVSNDDFKKAWQQAKPLIAKLCEFQKEILKEIGRAKLVLPIPEQDKKLKEKVSSLAAEQLNQALLAPDKTARSQAMEQLRQKIVELVNSQWPGDGSKIRQALNFLEQEFAATFRKKTLQGERPDARQLDQLRDISCQVGVLPRTHGSALFMRGQTKVLSILTLGGPADRQLLEGMEIVGKKRFMHHYNFPPYAPGEIRPMRGPGRREIGHGMLVEKALLPLVPSFDNFPYTMRVVSEVLSSNGSTSMASVSAACLALQDAGVPLKNPAAGISIGLVKAGDKYQLLTDIQGPEDHHGDMDFKIAGTSQGITAAQMDVKLPGITDEIFEKAVEAAQTARLQILEIMAKTLARSRPELSPLAPRIQVLRINPEKIKDLVGPGGRTINEIIAQTGVEIDIEQSGQVYVIAANDQTLQAGVEKIKSITHEPQIGETYQGKVKKIYDFGAMVEYLPGQVGLIHISQLSLQRISRVEDVVKVGDSVGIKISSIDEMGRINLVPITPLQPKARTGYKLTKPRRTGYKKMYSRRPRRQKFENRN